MVQSTFVEGSSQLQPGDYSDMTSTPIQPPPYANLLADLEAQRIALADLDEELYPPSRPASPNFDARTNALKAKIQEAIQYAGYNPRSAKWKRVADLVKTAATSRQYVGAAPGVRVGEMVDVDVGNYKFVLPETEEEWEQCEERWAKRFEKPPAPEGRTSKFFPAGAEGQRPSARTDVRDKVQAWQAKVVPAPPSTSLNGSDADTPSTSSAKGKGKDTERQHQSPLSFPVVKRHTAAPSGKDSPPADKNDSTPATSVQQPDKGVPDRSGPSPKGIADLSEMEYIPPSFPQQLETSTPLPNAAKKAKPPPILRQFPSSPSSSPQLPNSLDLAVPPPASSSSPPQAPPETAKRARPITPPSEASQRSPLAKRTKITTPPADPAPAPLAPERPTTPPPPASPPHTPPRPASSSKGLGNAKGLPVPRTPERGTPGQLPTLTDLLASSRRSRPRPRPPSRKLQSRTTTPAPGGADADDDALPTLAGAPRTPSPAPTAASRARTLFSSPASGSSGSPQSVPSRARSPVSPLFPHSGAFAPPFASTQAGGAPPASQSQVGYNSQFDVEGQVGMVSDLLERDVDFTGWIHDLPEGVDADA
ncbi:hypothetical protein PsYK624_042320 [Phanerochaete sordida]|uniref:Uncharacterized protein n=1 Tax=Phanerochaete sordida TaxID=48140 RepID=A0A9P3LB33_9APHY|nr:hypothetical protein PsYK624_042320 [Phanerochaete sordida]